MINPSASCKYHKMPNDSHHKSVTPNIYRQTGEALKPSSSATNVEPKVKLIFYQ